LGQILAIEFFKQHLILALFNFFLNIAFLLLIATPKKKKKRLYSGEFNTLTTLAGSFHTRLTILFSEMVKNIFLIKKKITEKL